MAKQIRIGIRLPSNNQLKSEMQSVIKYMEKQAILDFKIDTKEFSKSLSSMSRELGKLKLQLGKFNILEDIGGDASKIVNTKQKVNDLANAIGRLNEKSQLRTKSDSSNWQLKQAQAVNGALDEQYSKQLKLDSLRTQLQNKLNTASNNGLVDTGVIDKLQTKLNSINSDMAEREILELKNAITNLSSSDSSIIRVQNTLTKLQEKISIIKKNNIDIIDVKEIAELKQAESEVKKLKNTLSQLQTGNVIDGKAISNQINTATNSVRTLENQFKSVNTKASGLSDTMKNVFSYAIGGSAVYTAINSMKSAINTTIELDDKMRDLRRVTELTNLEYSNFMKTANKTAIELGTTTSGAIEATTRFSQLGYSFKESSTELSKYALVLSNVADMSAVDASSSIVSVLKGFQLETEDVSRITDVINEAGNKFAIDSSGLAAALKIGAANLSLAGNDLEQASALIITANEVMQDPTTVSNGLKTIGMRLRGVSEDGEELSATMNDLIKNMTGVSVEGLDGELRSTFDVLKDIGEVWDTLNTKQQALLSEEIAGKNRANVFASLMQNSEQLENAYDTLKNSAGSAEKEQLSYISALSGRINALKESLTGISIQMIDSDFLKGFVSSLTAGVNITSGFIDVFGGVPTAITATMVALTIFNSKFRETSNSMFLAIPGYGKLISGMNGYEKTLKSNAMAIKEKIKALKLEQENSLKTGESTTVLGRQMIGLNGKLALTTAGLITTKIATIALQGILSMGLSLAMSTAISGLTKLISSLNSGGKSMEDSKEQADKLATSLDNIDKDRELFDQYKNLREQLQDSNLEATKRNKLTTELESVVKTLNSSEINYRDILSEENGILDEQLGKLNERSQMKLFDDAKELDKSMLSQKEIDEKVDSLHKYITGYKELQDAINSGSEQALIDLIGTSNLEEANTILGENKNKINDLANEVSSFNSNILLMKDANYETNKSFVDLSGETDSFITTLNKSTKTINENTKAKEDNNSGGSGFVAQDIAELTKAYSDSTDRLKELHTLLNQVNEAQAITPELVSSLASKYPELGANITDTAYVQEFLNNKIAEEGEISRKAHQIMTENDVAYFNNKIKNTSQWQKYTVDVLNNIKNANVDYYNKNIEGMKTELQNANTLAESRAVLETNLVKSLATLWSDYYGKMEGISGWYSDGPSYQYAAGKGTKAYEETQAYLAQYNKVAAKAKELQATFSNFSSSAFVPFSAGDFSGLSSGDKGSSTKATEKEVANIEKLSDRYSLLQNRLDQVNNSLRDNKTLMENSSDENKLKYLDKEIQLLKEQKVALENIRKEREKELAEQKKLLQSKGFSFGGDGVITNESDRLDILTNWANSLSNDKKEAAQKSVKDIEETVKSYTSLLLKDIPDVTNEIKELTNVTIDSQKEIADILKKQRETAIENMEKETDALKKELQKRKDMMNKQWEDESFDDELKKKQDTLLDLNSQLQDAMRLADSELVKNIKKQIESAQSEINSFIGDNEKDKANDRFDEELNKLDEDLQSKIDTINNKLSDEQILVLVQNGVRDLDGVLKNVDSSTNKVVSTFSSIGNIIKNDWIENINIFADKIKTLLGTNLDVKGTVTTSDNKSNTTPIVINLENKPVINGTGMSKDEIEDLLETNNEKLIKTLSNAINNR